jgi:hypothetical protein
MRGRTTLCDPVAAHRGVWVWVPDPRLAWPIPVTGEPDACDAVIFADDCCPVCGGRNMLAWYPCPNAGETTDTILECLDGCGAFTFWHAHGRY